VLRDRARRRTGGELANPKPVTLLISLSWYSVRAWRGLRYNEKYAVKLERKLAKKEAQAKAKADAVVEAGKQEIAAISNPFSVIAYCMLRSFTFSLLSTVAEFIGTKSLWPGV
jgi:hypothetical protein